MTLAILLFGVILGIQRGLAPSALSFYLRRKNKSFPGRWGGVRTFFAPALPDLILCTFLLLLFLATSFAAGFAILLAGLLLIYRGIREARFTNMTRTLGSVRNLNRFPYRAPTSLWHAAVNDFTSPRLYWDSLLIAGPIYLGFPNPVSLTWNVSWFFVVYFTVASTTRYTLTMFRQRFRLSRRRRKLEASQATRNFYHFDTPDYLFSIVLIVMGTYFIVLGSLYFA